jgi:hypothetical protein
MYHDPCHTPMKACTAREDQGADGSEVPLTDRCCGESGTLACPGRTSRPRCASASRRRSKQGLQAARRVQGVTSRS